MKMKWKDLILPPGGRLGFLVEGISRYLGEGHEYGGPEVSMQFARVMASIAGEINQLMAEGLWKPNLTFDLLEKFIQLNDEGKKKLVSWSDDLVKSGKYKIKQDGPDAGGAA